MSRLVIASSILAADFGRLAEEVRAVDAASTDWNPRRRHGRKVPNISFGPVVVGADAIVAGSVTFKSHDHAAAIAGLRRQAMRQAECR